MDWVNERREGGGLTHGLLGRWVGISGFVGNGPNWWVDGREVQWSVGRSVG